MNDEIKIYKDQKLLDLGKQWIDLQNEEMWFLLNKQDVNEKGRTMKNIATDMIKIYSLTNEHLKNQYPDNEVAKIWIATNDFSSQLIKETWL